MRAHKDVEFVEMYSRKNSNVDVEYMSGKLRKRNRMSDVIRLHFWTLFLLMLCTVSCMLLIVKENLHFQFIL
jgi:hypothetical protein